MKIIEYKRHLIDGVVRDPDFVLFGGVFHNPDDNTWIGKVLDESERAYYVPDTLLELTRDDLVARQLAINALHPASKKLDALDPHSQSIPLSQDELVSEIDLWISESN